MANFVQRFIDIKTRIGGNREKHDFEFTFGTPVETRSGITMPAAAHNRRDRLRNQTECRAGRQIQ